ncbi:hypothetical protein AVEN_213642-1 [Araneus ventricosus]|uniref:Uncharacterized protein n=1 Tax=Araneus ventricosus TaxID=182803 RepID=A0A4Y2HUT4_ARAVE|nr:hypothetical protein AVEN_65478-1 [Araneus ventricosus]GBM68962.1 hypothetical protein AVEN_108039-1 [Araneus ventricosus]GBM68979.1 hypothetical protein AVEN_124730-1 [Araneus ventricosus]GBM69023.1 hypothetical protein AVEN_213642-1 [Araneus ventricosus]
MFRLMMKTTFEPATSSVTFSSGGGIRPMMSAHMCTHERGGTLVEPVSKLVASSLEIYAILQGWIQRNSTECCLCETAAGIEGRRLTYFSQP